MLIGLIVIIAIGITLVMLGGIYIDTSKSFLIFIGEILIATSFILGIKYSNKICIPDQYYLPAEILVENNNSTCFTTIQGKYIVDKANLDPDTEYLLTMASNNTQDVTDDEVCAIWEVK